MEQTLNDKIIKLRYQADRLEAMQQIASILQTDKPREAMNQLLALPDNEHVNDFFCNDLKMLAQVYAKRREEALSVLVLINWRGRNDGTNNIHPRRD